MSEEWFQYRKPTDEQVEQITNVREACKYLLTIINSNAKDCRAKSLAVTKLEEVSMWANKAIVFGEDSNR